MAEELPQRRNGDCVEVAAAAPVAAARGEWRDSSRSGGNGDCVEVAAVHPLGAVRDPKNPGGRLLLFGSDECAAFIRRPSAVHNLR
ncbi:DUF397 domain-containing protein [Actinomadura keratinilytica]|uniref:DUF397 domain-containing protein n=1 Tax=Actinomadura keratinilytica TaxID=547461 RepID=A0ABP7YA48_9ACTN